MVEDRNAQLAREHGQKAEDYTKQAGQHTASAASTVGHDIRAAGEQAAEAAKYVGARCGVVAPCCSLGDLPPQKSFQVHKCWLGMM